MIGLQKLLRFELNVERLNLLETLAERIADRILIEPQAIRVFVRIEKLDRGPGALGVEIVRSNETKQIRSSAIGDFQFQCPEIYVLSNEAFRSVQLKECIDKLEKIEKIKEDKQNPEKIDNEVKQVSEFEKDELFDPNNIAALIDKSKEESAEVLKTNDDITQDQERNVENTGLTLSEEDALKAQIFGCWSIPLGLPYNENLLVRIKLKLKPDGTVSKTEILDHARMNKPDQGFIRY